ncbi:hypothetical protein A8709_15135 [Paenibacillus pectinilyticus]|uniref:F5/8 type C domain-containing protein n=1 Tax=Paenibacillus pectinilyticus TaxID=512399 RepID=A0A1C1A4B9_9BACL|nr:carbohydrate binding domain-containing protein [Paenibacillus pectinilyticus]OCT15412.1 hypothetical protein A8709_15135 [Paenibacillus pectinilyticus]
MSMERQAQRIINRILFLVLLGTCLPLFAHLAKASATSYDIGAIYFTDWNPELNVTMSTLTQKRFYRSNDPYGGVRDDLTAPGPFAFGPIPDREPIDGWYDDRQQSVMDQHILEAASRGLGHFTFYWFWNIWGGGQANPGQQALTNYTNSPYKSLLKYDLMYVDSGDYPASDWNSKIVPAIVNFMKDGQYDKTPDGRPYFHFFSINTFKGRMGGDSGLSNAITQLRSAITAAGMQTPFITSDNSPNASDISDGVDGFMPLNSNDNNTGYSYPLLGNGASQFNPNPWRGTGYPGWANGTQYAIDYGITEPVKPDSFRYGVLPAAKNLLDTKASANGYASFYAWNETGEGGMIQPDTLYGYGFLNAMQDVFGLSNAAYKSYVSSHGLTDLDPSVRLEFAPDHPTRVQGDTVVIAGKITNKTGSAITGNSSIAIPSGWTLASSSGTAYTGLAAGASQNVSFTVTVGSGALWNKNNITVTATYGGSSSVQFSTFVVLAQPLSGVIMPAVNTLSTSGGSADLPVRIRNYTAGTTLSGTYTITGPAGWTISAGGAGSFSNLGGSSWTNVSNAYTLTVPSGTAAGDYDLKLTITQGSNTYTSMNKVRVVNQGDFTWESDGNANGWNGGNNVLNNIYDMVGTNNDPYILSPDNLGINAAANSYISLGLQNMSAVTNAQIYFTTTTDPSFSESKSLKFQISSGDLLLKNYVINMSANSLWSGTIKQVRIDPIDAPGVVKFEHVYINNSGDLAYHTLVTPSDDFSAPGNEAGRAVDGTVGINSRWISGSATGTHWLQLDLTAPYAVNRWTVAHSGAAGDCTCYNTKDYKLQYYNGSSWVDADAVTGNTANSTDRMITPITAQLWRLYVTNPNQSMDNLARISEVQLFGSYPTTLSTGSGGTEILNNPSFESGTGGWTTASLSINAVSTPAPVDGSKVVQATSRTQVDSWVGQYIGNALTAQGMGTYNISAWVRSASGTKNDTRVTVAVFYGGAWHEYSMTGTINASGWTEISGVIDAAWTGTLANTDAVFLVRQNNDTTDYYVDKVSIMKTTNVLQNPSYESGTTSWTTSQLTASTVTSPTPMNGSYAAQAASRTQVDSWIGQHMSSYLAMNGQGTYNISAWVRSSSGIKTDARVTISLNYGGAWHEATITGTINDTGWTLMTGTVNLAWTGTLDDAIFLVRQNNDTTSYVVDDCILAKK